MASASPSPTGAGVRIGRSPSTAAATTVSSAESDVEPGVTSSTSKVTASRAPSRYSAVRTWSDTAIVACGTSTVAHSVETCAKPARTCRPSRRTRTARSPARAKRRRSMTGVISPRCTSQTGDPASSPGCGFSEA